MEAEYPQINPLLLCSRRRKREEDEGGLELLLSMDLDEEETRPEQQAPPRVPSSAGGEDAESGKMSELNSYEEQRRRQIEDNRRKVEELHLHQLSAAVREAAARPKPKHKPRPKPKAPGPGELRRSGRVASLPEQPDYLAGAKRRDYRGGYEAHAAAKQKAEELQRRIHDIRWPAFVKPITHD